MMRMRMRMYLRRETSWWGRTLWWAEWERRMEQRLVWPSCSARARGVRPELSLQARSYSVKNSSNGLHFSKKRAKNSHLFGQKAGIKRAKLQSFNQKTGAFKKNSICLLETFLILLPFQMDFYLTL